MSDLSYDSIELNRDHGPWQYDWRALIERYLEAVDSSFPWHRERSPWGPPVAPPTLLGNATLRFLDSIAPVPPGTLHAKFDLEITNALRGDRELVGYGRFVEKYERRGRRWFVFSARFRDGPGLLVGHSTVTMAFPEVTGKGEEGRGKERAGVGEREAELTLPPRTLSREKIAAYSEDSANHERRQSIHTDLELARSFGFPDLVAQGMMSADYISELMTGRFERGWLLQGRLSLAFVAPSFAGDTLTAKAAKREELDEGAFIRQVYDAWCENQRGETVTVGTASGVVAAAG
jgi:acyl dehydratase